MPRSFGQEVLYSLSDGLWGSGRARGMRSRMQALFGPLLSGCDAIGPQPHGVVGLGLGSGAGRGRGYAGGWRCDPTWMSLPDFFNLLECSYMESDSPHIGIQCTYNWPEPSLSSSNAKCSKFLNYFLNSHLFLSPRPSQQSTSRSPLTIPTSRWSRNGLTKMRKARLSDKHAR